MSRKCHRCGRTESGEAVFHAFEFRLYADLDGVADPADEESFDRALAAVLRDEEKALDEKVYLEGRAVICPECREELLEALGLSGEEEEGGPDDDDESGTVH